ncbi:MULTISPECIES: TadE family type IV pilus minor pilin [unclassified Brevibacterium]|uniref:TadE family type IV pilus minor pilin n=1 Tax=unclassified Brevibacterium TaxID=2614124 RepID=UPI000B0109A6|nr:MULTISPECIES: TadE family type IV pilus minor pilin [unclassified Brevibacterium]
MTAEFAMIMPAIVLVILMVIGVGTLGLAQLRSYEAARAGAREAARGEPIAEVRRSAESKAGPGSAVEIGKDGEYTTVTVTIATPKTVRRFIPHVQAVQRARTESGTQPGGAQ